MVDAFAELAGRELAGACLVSYRERYAESSLVETTVVPGAPEALGPDSRLVVDHQHACHRARS